MCLRLKATVCTKALPSAKVFGLIVFRVEFRLVSRRGFCASLPPLEGHASPQGLNSNRGSAGAEPVVPCARTRSHVDKQMRRVRKVRRIDSATDRERESERQTEEEEEEWERGKQRGLK